MGNFQFRSLFLTFILFLFAHISLQAQQRAIGVRWDVPENRITALNQLDRFNSLGISLLEIESELSPEIWQKIDSLQFEVYGNIGITYPVASTFSKPDSSLIIRIQERASTFLSHPSVTAIGLFEYGATHNLSFFDAVEPIADQIKKSGRTELYYISRSPIQKDTALADFILFEKHITTSNLDTLAIPQNSNIGGYIYSPSSDLANYLHPFKKFLDATSASGSKAIFINSEWLLNILDREPQFSKILQSLTSESEAIFPLPDEQLPSADSKILPILILLFIWGTIGWHYNTSPLYRKSLFRYFFGHKFFIDDIFKRQIRSPLPAMIIILQNALLISAGCFVAFLSLFSSLGKTSFFYHFSSLTFFGNSASSIFIWMFLAAWLISLISIIWLSITNRSVSSLTQITTIFAWPLQLNFIFCTVIIAIFYAGASHQAIAIFTALAILVLLLSFIFASLDTLRFARSKVFHLVKTIIPYVAIVTALLVWILSKEQWMEVISLSLNLK